MSDLNIARMDFKQLRSEVQQLRDELAVLKRRYEDAIYNLDSDNFSKSFTVEQNSLRAQVSVTAEAIKTMVSDTDLQSELEKYSTIEQTAEQIESAVVRAADSTDEKLKEYSTITQTAEAITETVTKEYIIGMTDDIYVTNALLSAEISQSAEEIRLSVSQKYETKDNAADTYGELRGSISDVSLTASGISSRVENLETFKTSVFTQTADGFTLDGDKTTFTGVIYLTDNSGSKRFSLFHDESQGYEQVIIGSSGSSTGVRIKLGRSGDTLNLSDCSSIIWGSNAPAAVFG